MPLTVKVRGEPVKLTDDTLDRTWAAFAEDARASARAALAGEFFTNNAKRYAEEMEREARWFDEKQGRMSLTFIQRAVMIQTGNCVPILAPTPLVASAEVAGE